MAADFTAPSSLGIDFDDDDRLEQARREAAPGAPSFSLGIDFDDGEGRRPRREQATREVEPEAPSFSLGIDGEDEGRVIHGGVHRRGQPPREVAPEAPSFSLGIEEEDDVLLAGVHRREQEPSETLDPEPLPQAPRFKRLRRGPPPPPPAAARAAEVSPVVGGKAEFGVLGSLEEEIEEFSEEERPARDVPASVGSCSTSSSSKFSLRKHGVLASQSTSKARIPRSTPTSNASSSAVLEESCTKKLLPPITISPMRKIHLLDSDTDLDDSKNEQKVRKPVSPPKNREGLFARNRKSHENILLQKNKAQMDKGWATPALDEFCEEYFRSVKDSKPSRREEEGRSLCSSKVGYSAYSSSDFGGHLQCKSTLRRAVEDKALTYPDPPAMCYFFHDDPRICELVRMRLPHFVPIGAGSTRGNEQSGPENLNYIARHGLGDDANAQWVTPSRRTSLPTDVGRRRVQASGRPSGPGHWFTAENGRKVYVSKNGQELTGQIAYRHYRKESGAGFRKSKKKGSTRKGGSTRGKGGSSRAKKTTTTAKKGTNKAKRKR